MAAIKRGRFAAKSKVLERARPSACSPLGTAHRLALPSGEQAAKR